jgi:hypothetical protein
MIDGTWESNPDKDDPQGTFFTWLDNHPCLAKYMADCTSRAKGSRPCHWDCSGSISGRVVVHTGLDAGRFAA